MRFEESLFLKRFAYNQFMKVLIHICEHIYTYIHTYICVCMFHTHVYTYFKALLVHFTRSNNDSFEL